ncbi:hypothetical protein KC19_VG040900 [Ceratodon purpureus]|uniref:Uncharacterized protein n=1 Tax=Ceratodon purpureus TaxID=3225 RepID=A0A8T0HLR9_CERPU|nr:hypothetical protein KC19_VG040900 [Ceratodon purpureus]
MLNLVIKLDHCVHNGFTRSTSRNPVLGAVPVNDTVSVLCLLRHFKCASKILPNLGVTVVPCQAYIELGVLRCEKFIYKLPCRLPPVACMFAAQLLSGHLH